MVLVRKVAHGHAANEPWYAGYESFLVETKVVECDGEPFFELADAVFDCVAS